MFNKKAKKQEKIREAFENLKDNFVDNLDSNDKVILFTSTSERLKKTSVVLNLARELVYDDKKILIIDMNLRSPMLSKISKVEFNMGFSDILVKELPYENIITNDLYEKDLDMILSGRAMKNPDDFLELSKLRNLFDSVREKYDYILVDSPSNENYPDANMIAQSVDKVFLLTDDKDKKDSKLNKSIKKLEKMDAEIDGLIKLNSK